MPQAQEHQPRDSTTTTLDPYRRDVRVVRRTVCWPRNDARGGSDGEERTPPGSHQGRWGETWIPPVRHVLPRSSTCDNSKRRCRGRSGPRSPRRSWCRRSSSKGPATTPGWRMSNSRCGRPDARAKSWLDHSSRGADQARSFGDLAIHGSSGDGPPRGRIPDIPASNSRRRVCPGIEPGVPAFAESDELMNSSRDRFAVARRARVEDPVPGVIRDERIDDLADDDIAETQLDVPQLPRCKLGPVFGHSGVIFAISRDAM